MKRLKLPLCLAVAAAILLRPQAAVDGARGAMRLWCESVAPSLFPFLALMPALTGAEACRAYERLLGGLMGRLFGLPGAAAPAVAVGMVAGSPGGAIAVRSVAAQAPLSRADAKRLALALPGVSPAYLVLGVGHGLLGSAALGWRLAAVQAFVQLSLLVCLRGLPAGENMEEKIALPRPDRPAGMAAAVESALSICGYMVLFSAVAAVLTGPLGALPGAVLLLAADLPSGLARIFCLKEPLSALLGCAAIGFGGLCIGAQNIDALREIGVRPGEYFCIRGLAAALFASIGTIALHRAPFSAENPPDSALTLLFSIFFSCALAVPGLIILSKNLFLNKRNLPEN